MNFQENQVFEVCPSNGEEKQSGMEISPQQKLQSPQLFVLSKLDNYEAQLQVTNIKYSIVSIPYKV
jgi:epoxyqueuosine reductase QueG